MKFRMRTKRTKLIQIVIPTIIFMLFSIIKPNEILNASELPPFMEAKIRSIKDLREQIYELARENLKSTNIKTKGKRMGILSKNTPAHMQARADFTRRDFNIFGSIMNFPISVFRACIYPVADINYIKWCRNVNFGKPDKIISCQISFCNVCCDNLALEFEQITLDSRLATNLGMTSVNFMTFMKDYIQKSDQVTECRNKCVATYPADLPTSPSTPSRDPSLGSKENPGRDCIDIKVWGSAENRSGNYFIKSGMKGVFEVYCDMETDQGGWTLILNYNHSPGQDITLNGTVIPFNSKINSHLLLKDLGIKRKQVKEIRFQCNETFGNEKFYMHFKSSNNDIIETAFSGDQSHLSPTAIKSGYTILPKPPGWDQFRNRMGKVQIRAIDYTNKTTNGGFALTPFGSKKFESFWTILGDDPRNPVFECGSYHRNVLDSSAINSPSMARTSHQIYFRGSPPSQDGVRKRMLSKINKRAFSG